jgi:hypothetical protein
MRFILVSAALLSLSACATTSTAVQTATAPESSAPAPAVSHAAQVLASAGRANAANRADLERALGAPDIERREGAGVALTYRLETCALLLLLTADGRNEMRLAEAHPSARRPGEATPSVEQCVAEASQRR